MSFVNKSSQKFVPKARGRARARPSVTAPPDQDKVAAASQDEQAKGPSEPQATQADQSQLDGTQIQKSAQETQIQTQEIQETQVDGTQVDGTQVDGTQVDGTQVDLTQADGKADEVESTQIDSTQVDGAQVDSTPADSTQIQTPEATKKPEGIPKARPMFKLGAKPPGVSPSPAPSKPRTSFTPKSVPRSSARTNLSQAIPKSVPPSKPISSIPKGPISRPSGVKKAPAAPPSKLHITIPRTPSRKAPAISGASSSGGKAAPIPLSSPSGPLSSPVASPVSARSRNASSIPMAASPVSARSRNAGSIPRVAPPQSPSRPPSYSVRPFNRSSIGRARTSNVRGGDSDAEEEESAGTFRTSYIRGARGGSRSARGESPERPRVSSFAPINAYVRDTFDELPSLQTRLARGGGAVGQQIQFGETTTTRPGSRKGAAKRKRVAAVRTSRASPPLSRMRSPSPMLSPLPSPSLPSPPPAAPLSPPRKEYPVDEDGNIVLDPEDIRDRPWEAVESDEEDGDIEVTGQAQVEPKKPKKKFVINANKFTLADMCKDIPFAEKNENFDKFEEYRQNKRLKRQEVLQMKKLYRSQGRVYIPDETLEEERRRLEDERKNQWNEEFKNSEENREEPAAVQLKLGADGRMVVDSDSTVVDRHKATTNRAAEEKDAEDDQTDEALYGPGFTALSYSKRNKGDRWDAVETKEFYRAISQWGTDFALISQLFPGRNRRQIKLKFKQEEKKNPAIIHLALIRKLPIDLNNYSTSMDGGLQSAEDIEKELEEMQRQHEAQLRLDEEAREKAKREDVQAAEKAEEEQFGGVSTKRVKKKEDPELLGLHEDEEFVGYVGQV